MWATLLGITHGLSPMDQVFETFVICIHINERYFRIILDYSVLCALKIHMPVIYYLVNGCVLPT
jgi:hypothetical protein